MVYKYTRMHSLYIHMAVYNRSGNLFVSIPMLVGTGVGGALVLQLCRGRLKSQIHHPSSGAPWGLPRDSCDGFAGGQQERARSSFAGG